MATHYLQRTKGNIEAAMNEYYDSLQSKANDLFQMFANGEQIDVSGTARLCEALSTDPSDTVMLALAYTMRCKTMCVFTRTEWLFGCNFLNVLTLPELKAALQKLRNQMKNMEYFKNVYEFTFHYAKEPHCKLMEQDTAIALWELMLKDFLLIPKWIEFLKHTPQRMISKDTWNLMLDFCKTSLEEYNPDAAWPTIFDEFVLKIKNGLP